MREWPNWCVHHRLPHPFNNEGCLHCEAESSGKPVILVDADIVTFQAAATCETTVTFDESDDPLLVQEPDLAFFRCRQLLGDIMENLGSPFVILCFSGSDNFRKDALSTYKGNRKDAWKPKLLGPLKERLCETYPNLTVDRLEADDLLGVLTRIEVTVIATIDKDLDQIPGPHFNWKKQETYSVDRDSADLFRWLQVLTGDSTDGYTGIPGVGPKTAAKLLKDVDPADYRKACWKAYESKGLTEEDFKAQAIVAQILRPPQYDWKGGVIRTPFGDL